MTHRSTWVFQNRVQFSTHLRSYQRSAFCVILIPTIAFPLNRSPMFSKCFDITLLVSPKEKLLIISTCMRQCLIISRFQPNGICVQFKIRTVTYCNPNLDGIWNMTAENSEINMISIQDNAWFGAGVSASKNVGAQNWNACWLRFWCTGLAASLILYLNLLIEL